MISEKVRPVRRVEGPNASAKRVVLKTNAQKSAKSAVAPGFVFKGRMR
jgi:hypothetical protein